MTPLEEKSNRVWIQKKLRLYALAVRELIKLSPVGSETARLVLEMLVLLDLHVRQEQLMDLWTSDEEGLVDPRFLDCVRDSCVAVSRQLGPFYQVYETLSEEDIQESLAAIRYWPSHLLDLDEEGEKE